MSGEITASIPTRGLIKGTNSTSELPAVKIGKQQQQSAQEFIKAKVSSKRFSMYIDPHAELAQEAKDSYKNLGQSVQQQ